MGLTSCYKTEVFLHLLHGTQMIYVPLILRRAWGLHSCTMANDHVITEHRMLHSNQLHLQSSCTPTWRCYCVAKCKVMHVGKRNASFRTARESIPLNEVKQEKNRMTADLNTAVCVCFQ